IELKPDYFPAWQGRGISHAQSARWEKASADFARAIQLKGANHHDWSHHALLRLQLGDVKGYRKACGSLLERFGQRQQPEVAYTIARACSLAPNAVNDLSEVVQASERALAQNPRSYPYTRALGAVLYRAGKFKEAEKRLKEAAALQPQAPTVWLFLALACSRLGETEEAGQWLDKAGKWIDQAREKKPGEGAAGPLSWDKLPWEERLALELLRREAEALVKGKASPAK